LDYTNERIRPEGRRGSVPGKEGRVLKKDGHFQKRMRPRSNRGQKKK